MSNYSTILEEIRNDRKQILSLIKENLKNNINSLNYSIENIINTIKMDEENEKKIKSILNIQSLIESLSSEILNCNTEDDIKNIRKKLNYYINKVKLEIKNRNISNEETEKYSENLIGMRKNISECIRIFKRESIVNDLSIKFENGNLTKEELKEIRKKIKSEKSFNKRLNNVLSPKSVVIDNSIIDNDSIVDNNSINDNNSIVDSNSIIYGSNDDALDDEVNENIPMFFDEETIKLADSNINSPNSELYKDMLVEFRNMYQLADNQIYDSTFFKNIRKLIFNVPNFIHNKKIIKRMKYDCVYCTSDAFRTFINYSNYGNSIIRSLEYIFSRSKLCSSFKSSMEKHSNYMNYLLVVSGININELNNDNNPTLSLNR